MWKHNQSEDGFVFAVALRPGTRRIVVSAMNWVDTTEVLVRLFDREEREIRLIAMGRDLHGAAEISGNAGARLSIGTSTRPARLAIWSHSRPHSFDVLRRVLPVSLSGVAEHIPGFTNNNPAEIPNSAELASALEEIAWASFGGSIKDNAVAAAISLLQHLALHPLDRSTKLGALVAALCQKQGTIWR